MGLTEAEVEASAECRSGVVGGAIGAAGKGEHGEYKMVPSYQREKKGVNVPNALRSAFSYP